MIKLYFPILTLGFLMGNCLDVKAQQPDCSKACQDGFELCMNICKTQLKLDEKSQCAAMCVPAHLKCNPNAADGSSDTLRSN